jgi:hypothetical protein
MREKKPFRVKKTRERRNSSKEYFFHREKKILFQVEF